MNIKIAMGQPRDLATVLNIEKPENLPEEIMYASSVCDRGRETGDRTSSYNINCHPDHEHFAALSINSAKGEGSIFGSHFQNHRSFRLTIIWILRPVQNDD